MVDVTVAGAAITAIAGVLAIILNRLRCRFLISEDGWSFGAGYTEQKLPPLPPGGSKPN